MKKLIKTFALILCLVLAPCTFLLTGCGNKEQNTEVDKHVEEVFTVSYKYDYARSIFTSVKEKDTIEKGTWITTLPGVVDEYCEHFLGWFVVGTDKQIKAYDVIGGDVILEARFANEGTSPVKNGIYYVYESDTPELTTAALVFNGEKVTMSMAVDPGIINSKENDVSTGTYEQVGENVLIDFGSEVNFTHGPGDILTLEADGSTTIFKLMTEEELITKEKSLLRESFGYTQGNDYAYKIIPLEVIDANGIQKVKIERYNLWATDPPTRDETFATIEGRCAVSGYGIEIEFNDERSWFGTYSYKQVTTGEHAGKIEIKLSLKYDCSYGAPGMHVESIHRTFTYYI